MVEISQEAGGIGGAATVKGVAHVPIGVAGSNGVLQFTILEDGDHHRTPPLLPIGWLESVGASIDCKHDLLFLEDWILNQHAKVAHQTSSC